MYPKISGLKDFDLFALQGCLCLMKKLVLASTSPGRAGILSRVGMDYVTFDASKVEEYDFSLPPREAVKKNALLKAEYAADYFGTEDVILAADTVASLNDEVFLKPRNDKDACEILSKLSGKVHEVFTGFVLICRNGNVKIEDSEKTLVRFKELTKNEIINYIKSGDHLGKSGAYAVQGRGAAFVKEIYGDYFNIVGLPVFRILQLLDQYFNIRPF